MRFRINKRCLGWLFAVALGGCPTVQASSLLNFNNVNQPLQSLNRELREAGVLGRLEVSQNDGLPIYKVNGQVQDNLPVPVQHILLSTHVREKPEGDSANWLPGAPAGIHLLKRYSYQEFMQTEFSNWVNGVGYTVKNLNNNQVVLWSTSSNARLIGYEILAITLETLPRFFENRQKALDHLAWRQRLFNNISELFVGFTGRKVHPGLAMLGAAGGLITFVALVAGATYLGYKTSGWKFSAITAIGGIGTSLAKGKLLDHFWHKKKGMQRLTQLEISN